MKGRLRGSVLLCLLIALVGAALIAGCGGGGGTTTTTEASETKPGKAEPAAEPAEEETASIEPAPAFTAADLEEPGSEWLTNGGSLTNDRFSPLKEIDTSNVKELKGDWMAKIGKNATAAKFSAEGTALEYKGTIYISDGADDVFAIRDKTGEILWEYEPHLPADPLGEVVCCGWDNRGVAIGEGMVFVSQLNGDEVALDQETGKVKWSNPVVSAKEGYSITSAPLYYNGRVYVGGSGGEYGIRGRLTALDAKTGKIDWRFYTVPGPGEVGHDTWPKKGDAWKHGGAGIWNTPTVDPKLNMLYFSTSNASPVSYGAVRPGDNLFSSSIVALDAETGKYKWHYQEVHHDIWDYDLPSPTVLFDAEMEGKMREAVAEPSKTGYLYVLDRKTGKPIFPIPEKAVPQAPQQATSPTQPIPTLPPFSPQYPTKAALKIMEEGVAEEPEAPKLIPKSNFYPLSENPNVLYVSAPQNIGGDNWPPSSFDQQNHMYYVCSQSGAVGTAAEKHPPTYKSGERYSGSFERRVLSGVDTPGFLTAYDLSKGKIAWQDHFSDSCYSGAVTTAGGLIFVGRNTGELQAYDAGNGKKLWSFQTGGGANTTATVFEDEGEEKVAIYAGGNSLAATPHSENFWVFSLKGTMAQLKSSEREGEGTEAKGEGNEAAEKREEEIPSEEAGHKQEKAEKGSGGGPDAMAGKEVFSENCSTCHGATGKGGNGGPDLTTMPKAKEQKGAEEQVTNGGGGMPAFKGQLNEEEIANVAAYVVETIVGK
jgi:quinohemoprotein ethanol dehydrogenase